jgi:hypothetical protein
VDRDPLAPTPVGPQTQPHGTSLAGFTIGVTADRRRDELAALLHRRGARVVLAPALRIVPLADDTDLRAATLACLADPPDIVMANTGIGMRGWLEAAEGWGVYDGLLTVLSRAYLVARGPKARGGPCRRSQRRVVTGLGELRRGDLAPARARRRGEGRRDAAAR